MPSPSRFSHAVLKSPDHLQSIAWYAQVLQGKVVYQNEFIAFMTYDQEHHRIGVSRLPGDVSPASATTPGLSHLAFAFANVRELLEQYRFMKSLGYQPRSTINHGATISFYFADLDGNGVEFLVDRFDDPEEAAGWMYTDVYRKNPLGLPVDPDELLSRMDDGATDEELLHFDEEAAMAFDYEGYTRGL